jgi:cation diffusion facilitator family transporter
MNATIKLQRNIAFLAMALFLVKIFAWWTTKSVAIFTDALESIINVTTGFIGLYSVWLASKPRDRNHPYGHGKVEFISAAIEGTLISIAGIVIIFEATKGLRHPIFIHQLDTGLLLLAVTAIINGIVGFFAIKHGKSNRSAAVEAAGRHLLTDTYSTSGVIIGLLVLKMTGWLWLDVAIALIIACIVLFTGYKVLRSSLAGIMDEADMKLLEELIAYINENRKPQWTDLHNLRVIKYGNILHLDGHLTLPWYYNVKEAHAEIKALDYLIQQKFEGSVELFVHVDNCEPFSCEICSLKNCPERIKEFRKRIDWTVNNVLQDKKHNSY